MFADPVSSSLMLFAQDAGIQPFWMNDTFIKIACNVISASSFAGITWWVATRFHRSTIRHLRMKLEHHQSVQTEAVSERDRQSGIVRQLQTEHSAINTKLSETLARYEKVLQTGRLWRDRSFSLESALKGANSELKRLRKVIEQLTAAKLQLESEIDQLTNESKNQQGVLTRAEQKMHRALRLEGQLWTARAQKGRPKFLDMATRQQAIISVLNLKGGVGKTTVTAHLGAALAQRGYRVLVIDLDLQGSLTTQLLPQDKLTQLFDSGQLLQHFFNKAANDRNEKITGYLQDVLPKTEQGGCLKLIGTTDHLAYSELNLTMRWLLQMGVRDTRFLLRRALHLLGKRHTFDIVLLDCPPLVNISCVNALAASDYLLIPTTLSRKSVERVPKLLNNTLKNEKFLKYINHQLRILGVVANRTWRANLTDAEQTEWKRLATKCKDVTGQAVTMLETIIPQFPKEIRDSESEFSPPDPNSRLSEAFAKLAEEIEKELPSECRRLAKTPQ